MFDRFALVLVTIVTFAVLSLASIADAVDIECPIMADTVLCGHSSENNLNCGARGRLRVKGYQGIVVFRFDMSPAQGLAIEGGTLSIYCAGISGDAQDETSSEGISTIAHDWIEGIGDYTVSEDSATYLWPGKDVAETWGEDDNEGSNRYGPIDILDVVNGNGGSIVNSQVIWNFRVDEWTDIELDAELVQGLVDGGQYGIVVWRDTTGVNLDLASRELQGEELAPKLVVHGTAAAVNPGEAMTSTWGALKSMR